MRHGVPTLSSDAVVHVLLREDPDVRRALAARWGERILDGHGSIDRRRVAEIVFADRDELDFLEAELHPRVLRESTEWRARLAARPRPPTLCAVEVPLLYETGGDERFDAVVVVTAPEHVRTARARVPPAGREIRLIPDDEKVRRADYAYVNTGTLEDLDAWVARVVRELEERAR